MAIGFRDKGAIFENIVYMAIKQYQPQYVYQEQNEIDFLFQDTLLEVKYHAELSEKQMTLFEKFKASKKIIIKNYGDFERTIFPTYADVTHSPLRGV